MLIYTILGLLPSNAETKVYKRHNMTNAVLDERPQITAVLPGVGLSHCMLADNRFHPSASLVHIICSKQASERKEATRDKPYI